MAATVLIGRDIVGVNLVSEMAFRETHTPESSKMSGNRSMCMAGVRINQHLRAYRCVSDRPGARDVQLVIRRRRAVVPANVGTN